LIASPSRESYLNARELVIEDESYDAYSSDLNEIGRLLEQRRFEEAERTLRSSMPNLLLSPRVHLYAAAVARELGDEERAQLETQWASACAEGILATGDGSLDKAHIVCRVTDEYDVLQYLGKERQSQTLHEIGDRRLDRVVTRDGVEMWFDVTDPLENFRKRMSK
jgi:hypothetical protein